jgi:hypothetical protein
MFAGPEIRNKYNAGNSRSVSHGAALDGECWEFIREAESSFGAVIHGITLEQVHAANFVDECKGVKSLFEHLRLVEHWIDACSAIAPAKTKRADAEKAY